MFERDLRLQARSLGLNFDSGEITRRVNSTETFARSEEDVFRILGLDFIRELWLCYESYAEL